MDATYNQVMPRLPAIIFDHRSERSLAHHYRAKRFQLFLNFIRDLPRPVRILDIGGEQAFWQRMDFYKPDQCNVVILNIQRTAIALENFSLIEADAGKLNRSEFQPAVDVVFSNSVIEHLGRWEIQKQMAAGIIGLGRRYFLQTPNMYFPIEPHFHIPYFNFLPLQFKTWLLQHFQLGWYEKISNQGQARELILSHRLLSEKELRALFPEGIIYREKVLGITKSFVIYGYNYQIKGKAYD